MSLTKDSAWCTRHNMLSIIKFSNVLSYICSSNTSMTLNAHVVTKSKNDMLLLGELNKRILKRKQTWRGPLLSPSKEIDPGVKLKWLDTVLWEEVSYAFKHGIIYILLYVI